MLGVTSAKAITMLVLSRKEGEQVQIGDGITITVVKITNQGIRLGIDAPPNTNVARKELLDRQWEEARSQPEE